MIDKQDRPLGSTAGLSLALSELVCSVFTDAERVLAIPALCSRCIPSMIGMHGRLL